MRALRTIASALMIVLVATPAYAAQGEVPETLSLGVGIVSLVVGAVLLVVVVLLKRTADGAAIAEYISWVVAAVLALVAAVLVGWVVRFLPTEVSAEQARMGADLLVIASMVFFAVYFWRVRGALTRFMGDASEMLRRMHGDEGGAGDEAVADDEGGEE
jgi:Kef-type K+ transport system membrane component KefB